MESVRGEGGGGEGGRDGQTDRLTDRHKEKAETETMREKGIREGERVIVCCLLSVQATYQCISGTDLLRQFYVLPHRDRSCQTFHLTQLQYTDTGPTSPSTALKHQAPGKVATGVTIFKSLVWLDPEKIPAQVGFEPGIFCSRGGRHNH